MQHHDLLERIFGYVEQSEVEKAARTCLRLSRHIGDHMNTALFLHELFEEKKEIIRVLFDETSHLKEDAQRYVYQQALERWLQSRSLTYGFGVNSVDGESKNVLVIPVGEFSTEIEQCEKSIADWALPSGMGEYDTAAFADRHNDLMGQFRLRIRAINTIKSRVLNHCLNFAIQVEKQLQTQEKSVSFLQVAQNEVQNYFKTRSEDVYEKLQKANQLVDSTSAEDHSLLLTQVRRAVKAVADFFYPSEPYPRRCVDGVERTLGDEQYLNRLHEFVYTQFPRSTSTELLRAELEYLMVFARRLNDVASKGVHASVSMSEAKQGLLGLYLFLYNICMRLVANES
jgi:predicted CopG family antitoxin